MDYESPHIRQSIECTSINTDIAPRVESGLASDAVNCWSFFRLDAFRGRRILLGKPINSAFQSAFILPVKQHSSAPYSASYNVLIWTITL